MSTALRNSSASYNPLTTTPFYAQYRNSNTVVVLKERHFGLTVTIHDILGKNQPIQMKFPPGEVQQLCNQSATKVVEDLIQKKLFSPNEITLIHGESDSLFSVKECLKEIESELSKFKYNPINSEEKESDILSQCCPITLAPFIDPVIDDHGHTFEKEAIEEYLKNTNACPISREPIKNLIPNRVLKESIEGAKQKDPIPSLGLCKDEKPSIAKINLDLAKAHEEDGDYQEALNAYKKAFEYTKSSKDYRLLPPLFLKMKEPQKALAASLRLAKYQLEESNLQEALDTLEEIHKTHLEQRPTAFVILCAVLKEKKRLIALALDEGEALVKTSPREAKILYQAMIEFHPHFYQAYFSLEPLISDAIEKKQLLLKGACHAIEEKNYLVAQELYDKSTKFQGDDWLARLVQISLLQYQGNQRELHKVLQLMGEDLRKRKCFDKSVKVAKLLLGLEESSTHYKQIISDYQHMQSPKERKWTQVFSDYLLNGKNEKTIENPEELMLIASALKRQEKIEGGVGVLYNAISFAFAENRTELLPECLKLMREWDPKLTFLSPDQRILLGIIERLPATRPMSKPIPPSSESKEVKFIGSSESKESEDMTLIAFGKPKWAKYIGDVGVEPPLPKDILQILNAPCPFWPDKKVRETHILCLIPEKVNGTPLTLNNLEKLTKNPKVGKGIGYTTFLDRVRDMYGEAPSSASHWVMMTRDVIEESRKESYERQVKLVTSHIKYEVPTVLEATTAISMEYIERGTRLFSDSPWTFTRCKDTINGYPLIVGGFGTNGLVIGKRYGFDLLESDGIVGCRTL